MNHFTYPMHIKDLIPQATGRINRTPEDEQAVNTCGILKGRDRDPLSESQLDAKILRELARSLDEDRAGLQEMLRQRQERINALVWQVHDADEEIGRLVHKIDGDRQEAQERAEHIAHILTNWLAPLLEEKNWAGNVWVGAESIRTELIKINAIASAHLPQ